MNVPSLPSLSAAAQSMADPAQGNADVTALEAALVALKTGDFQARWDAAKLIPAFGEAAIGPLLELLQVDNDEDGEEDWELHWFVARTLGSFNHPQSIVALTEILRLTDQTEIAAMAATTLATFGVTAVPALTELLSRPSTCLIAVQALAQVQHPVVIPALLSVLDDPAAAVRSAGIEALSHFHDDSIIRALQLALQDSAAAVRRAAVVALGLQVDWVDAAQLTQCLTPLLWDLNLEVCRQAAIALGRVGTEAAIAVLAQGLRSAHTPIDLQIEIVRALAWIGTATALAPLQQYFDISSENTSSENTSLEADAAPSPTAQLLEREIIAILGRVESPESRQTAVQLLLDLLEVNHPISQTLPGKQQIALSLGQLQDPRAIDALIPLLADAEVSVRLHTLAALKQLTVHGAYERLQMLLNQDAPLEPALKSGIETALQEWQIHPNGNG